MTCPHCRREGDRWSFIILGVSRVNGSTIEKNRACQVETKEYNLRACPSCMTVFVEEAGE